MLLMLMIDWHSGCNATQSLTYYAALLLRRGRILRRTLSVRLFVRLSVRPVIVTERLVAPPSELQ